MLAVSNYGNSVAASATEQQYETLRRLEAEGRHNESFALREAALATLVNRRLQQQQQYHELVETQHQKQPSVEEAEDGRNETPTTTTTTEQEQQLQLGNDAIVRTQHELWLAELDHEIAVCAEDLVRHYCCVALAFLNRNQFPAAFELLQKAHNVATQGEGLLFGPGESASILQHKVLSSVENNLGLFYFRSGSYEAAVQHLAQAVSMEASLGPQVVDSMGTTLINLAQAQLAAHAVEDGVESLQRAVVALDLQANQASVLIQVEEARNLAVHACGLLGMALEELGEYRQACDAFGQGIRLLKSIPRRSNGSTATGTTAAQTESRIRQFVQDRQRNEEKLAKLPSIGFRSKFNSHGRVTTEGTGASKQKRVALAMKVAGVHSKGRGVAPSVVQGEAIVTSTLPLPPAQRIIVGDAEDTRGHHQPPRLPLPVPAASSSRPASAKPISSATTAASPYALPVQPSPAAFAASAPSSQPHRVTSSAVRPPERPEAKNAFTRTVPAAVHSVEPAGDDEDVYLPPAAADAKLAALDRYGHAIPAATREAFRRNAPGLDRVYASLGEKEKTAFDELVRPRAKSARPNSASAAIPAVLLFGGPKAQGTYVAPPPSRPLSTAVTPRARSPVLRDDVQPLKSKSEQVMPSATPLLPSAQPNLHLKSPPTAGTAFPTRPMSGNQAATHKRVRSSPYSSTSDAAKSLTRPEGVGPMADAAPSPQALHLDTPATTALLGGSGRSTTTPSHARERAADRLAAFVAAQWSQRVVTHKRQEYVRQLQLRLRIRHEEEARAAAAAKRQLQLEQARLERERMEMKLKYESRRQTTDPLDLPASSTLCEPVVVSMESPQAVPARMQVLTQLAARALTELQHVGDQIQELESTSQTTRQELQQRMVEVRQQRVAATHVVQRFLRSLEDRRLVSALRAAQRSKLLHAISDQRFQSHMANRIIRFLRWATQLRREWLRDAAEKAKELKRKTSLQLLISPFVRAYASSLHRYQTHERFIKRQVITIQKACRAATVRSQMTLMHRFHLASVAKRRAEASRIVFNFMVGMFCQKARRAAWRLVQEQNMSRKRDYAATRIQAMWRGRHQGPPLEREWRANLALHRREQQLLQDRVRLARSMLDACLVLQRAYRCHLARRQRRYLALRRERARMAYLSSHMQNNAARLLQRFQRYVVAQAEANRRRECRDALIRAQRLKLQAEEEERRSLLGVAVGRIQAVGRAYLERESMGRITKLVRPTSAEPRYVPIPSRNLAEWHALPALRLVAQEARGTSPMLCPSGTTAASEPGSIAGGVPSPALYQFDLSVSATHTPLGSFRTEQQQTAAALLNDPTLLQLIEQVVGMAGGQGETEAAAVSNEEPATTSSGGSGRGTKRPYKSFQRGMLVHVVPHGSALSTTSSMEAGDNSGQTTTRQPTQEEGGPVLLTPQSAATRIARCFRRYLVRKAAVLRRSEQRIWTLQDEAARFIQDAWRRSRSKTAMQQVRKVRAEQRLQTIREESAVMIQKLFRGHRVRCLAGLKPPIV